MNNLLLGGAAGDGIETMSALLEQFLKSSGTHFFVLRDFMSRVRGGHNFSQIRFGNKVVSCHRDELDGIFAVDLTTFDEHINDLKADGFILCDEKLKLDDSRVISLPLKQIAKDLGNPKVFNSVALGALLKLYNYPIGNLNSILVNNMRSDLVEINYKAIKKGYDLVDAQRNFEAAQLNDYMVVNGNVAIGLGALAAGIGFYSAYPMSPSTTILNFFSQQSEAMKICVEQAEDEIAAINMALGASYAGSPAMTGTSGGGFSLMVEALGLAGIAEIPIVIANVQRPGPATGLPTRTEQSDLKFAISASQGEFPRMVIAMRDHQDCFYQTARAFGLAQKYQIPVILLSDQYLGDGTSTTKVFDPDRIYSFTKDALNSSDEKNYKRYQLTENGISPLRYPGQSKALVRIDSDEHDENGQITESSLVRNQMVEKRAAKLEALKEELLEPEFYGDEKCDHLLIGFGSTKSAIKEALDLLNSDGQHCGALFFSDVYPLPTQNLLKYCGRAKNLINVEQNATGQLAALIRETTSITFDDSILKYDGRQLSVDDILKEVQKIAGGKKA